QHPERNFRLRPAWGVEIEDFARRGGIVRELSNGLCWWILFTNLFPTKFGCIGGWRLRIPSFLTRPRTSCAASGAGASHATPARVRAPSNAMPFARSKSMEKCHDSYAIPQTRGSRA